MKKILLFAIIGFTLFSCSNDDDTYVEFEKSNYVLHHDETVQLKLNSSENTNLFTYYVNAPNVVKISSEGIAKGLYVGETPVVAKYGDLTAECNVTVEPYVMLYRMIPLVTGGIDRATIKFLENAIDRDTLPAPMNMLVIAPAEEDTALDRLEYSFESTGLTSVSAFLKNTTGADKITLFMKERYPYREGAGYEDAGSGAKVRYIANGNKIEYTW